MVIGATLVGVFILGLIIFAFCISENKNGDFDTGVSIGVIIALLFAIEMNLVSDIIAKPKPSALDVYRGNTELEITSVNGTPIDTVVVFKNSLPKATMD